MIIENKYLRKAVEKAGVVVIVKNYQLKERISKLEYISPSATLLGMNVELLNKGMKLTEDYIFPEDRQKVIQIIYRAIEGKVEEYVHQYRMVGDDGELYYVSNAICVGDEVDGQVTVEFYLHFSTEKVEEKPLEIVQQPEINQAQPRKLSEAADISDAVKEDKKLEVMMKAFADVAELYSAFVTVDGRIVFQPTGPATNLGDFYDLFEKPEYKEYYKYIKQVVMDKNEPMVLEREEGGLGRISAAPIQVDGVVRGFWILGSYTAEETEQLIRVSSKQWELAGFMSDYLAQCKVIEVEAAKSRGAGMKLREELARQNIINNALTKINSKLFDTIDEVIEETVREVGLNLDINKIVLYVKGSEYDQGYSIRSYWDVSGMSPDQDVLMDVPKRMYLVEDAVKKGNSAYFADNSNMTEKKKINLMRFNLKAMIAYPIFMNGKLYGAMLFAESKTERVWTKEELRFTQSISLLVQNMLETAEGDENIRNVNKHIIEAYNNFKVGIFVKEAATGEVLFSNTYMNEMMGFNFVGNNSKMVLTDLHDKFDDITGMRKGFMDKERVTNWRSYIKVVDDIMDITEIKIEWLKGEQASLIILRSAKD